MAHNKVVNEKDFVISSIILPGDDHVYEIHDASAIHSVDELGISGVLRFMGVKKTEADVLALDAAEIGDVWLVDQGENAVDGVGTVQTEYVCVKAISGTANADAWEKLGNIHDAASSNHTHKVEVTGTNASSNVTGTINIPTIAVTQRYLVAEAEAPELTTENVTITATAEGTTVVADGTVEAITTLGSPQVENALGSGTTFKAEGGEAVINKMVTSTVNSVEEHEEVTASKINGVESILAYAKVTNGVLTFGSAEVSEVSTSKVTTSEVTVATGEISENGDGADIVTDITAIIVSVDEEESVGAITGFDEHSTTEVMTGVKVEAEPTINIANGTVIKAVEAAAPTVTIRDNGKASDEAVQVTYTTTDSGVAAFELTAEAQEWTGGTYETTDPTEKEG